MRRKDLDEGYGIMINERGNIKILFCFGKQMTEHVALVFNHLSGYYSYIVIGSGLAIKFYKFLSEAVKDRTRCDWFEENIKNNTKLYDMYCSGCEKYREIIKSKNFMY